ncbi:MAG: flavodoxin domain-containing protein [archaeon]|nr:flavodoxin domain-containing protein [archaeon]MCP8315082.1 flavodoxin domain-containing protein [archaeon]MCP8317843.1 flavodoxin domain-containing protein [archaeon]MCP8321643.1 flavodoxin domain-containing protein [archaeon]
MQKVIAAYSTVYGNTKTVAEAICEAIEERKIEAECKNVKDLKPEELANFDVILLGSPTHRESVSDDMKDFLGKLKKVKLKGKNGAAFDTRYADIKKGAIEVLEKSMRELGINIILPGQSVIVKGAKGPIAEGELSKCKDFGKSIVEKIAIK